MYLSKFINCISINVVLQLVAVIDDCINKGQGGRGHALSCNAYVLCLSFQYVYFSQFVNCISFALIYDFLAVTDDYTN